MLLEVATVYSLVLAFCYIPKKLQHDSLESSTHLELSLPEVNFEIGSAFQVSFFFLVMGLMISISEHHELTHAVCKFETVLYTLVENILFCPSSLI